MLNNIKVGDTIYSLDKNGNGETYVVEYIKTSKDGTELYAANDVLICKETDITLRFPVDGKIFFSNPATVGRMRMKLKEKDEYVLNLFRRYE